MTQFFTWNVNGIRACCRHDFVTTLEKYKPDVVGLQEVRASKDQIPEELRNLKTYPHQYYLAGEKKGYSGVAILSKVAPDDIIEGKGIPEFDREGRVMAAIYSKFIYISTYFPNSQDAGKRLDYKISFCKALQLWLKKLSQKYPKKTLVLAGDFNIAHEEIDLARPNDNHDSPGFLAAEREWMTQFLSDGWIDTFRHFHPKTVKYSWWSARTKARERNIGWRIDYHTVYNCDPNILKKADILDNVLGSDHCPVTLTLDL